MKPNRIKYEYRNKKLPPEHWVAIAKAESKNFSVFISEGNDSHEFEWENCYANRKKNEKTNNFHSFDECGFLDGDFELFGLFGRITGTRNTKNKKNRSTRKIGNE